MLRRPEIEPVSAIRGGEKEILDDLIDYVSMRLRISVGAMTNHSEKEPKHDLATENAREKPWYVAGRLAIIVWQSKEQHASHSPHEQGYEDADADDESRVRDD